MKKVQDSKKLLQFALLLAMAFGMVRVFYPAAVSAQSGGVADITGLEQGERDTMLLDLRMNGADEKDREARLGEDKIQPDELRVRRESLEETRLLRAEEQAHQQKMIRQRADEAGAESRRRVEDQIEEKKRDFEFRESRSITGTD